MDVVMYPKGTVIEADCAHCFQIFNWEFPDHNSVPPAYCSKACRRKQNLRNREWKLHPRPCPNPTKYRHTTAEAAAITAPRLHPGAVVLRPYHCRCGYFHLGRRDYRVIYLAPEEENDDTEG